MLKPFFIIGLPRSRTAWMANYLTHNDTFCHHDGMNGCYSIEEYREKIGSGGDSSSGLLTFDFEKHFSGSKKVIIHRGADSARQHAKAFFNSNIEPQLFEMHRKIIKIEGMHVDFDELDGFLPEICEYLGIPFDAKRTEMLVKMNMQVQNPLDIDYKAMESFLSASFLQ